MKRRKDGKGGVVAKGLFGLVMSAVLLGGCATGLTQAEMQDIDTHLADYYNHPDPDWALSALPLFEKMMRSERTAFPAFGFVYGAAKAAKERKDDWALAAKGHSRAGVAVGYGLEGKTLDDVVGAKYEDYAPELLDLIWGYFMATGDPVAPRRVIHRGGMKVPERADVDLTARSAVWSACSLAKGHPAVKAELESFALAAEPAAVLNFFGAEALDEDVSKLLSAAANGRITDIQKGEGR